MPLLLPSLRGNLMGSSGVFRRHATEEPQSEIVEHRFTPVKRVDEYDYEKHIHKRTYFMKEV